VIWNISGEIVIVTFLIAEKLQEAKGLKVAMVSEKDELLKKFFQSKYHSILK
jgi:hypothetical protein